MNRKSTLFVLMLLLLTSAFAYAQDLGPRDELCLTDPDPRLSGEQVKALQRFLLSEGIDIGPDGIDGWFGKDTDKALREYEKLNKLPVDGRIKISDIPLQLHWQPVVISTLERGLDEGPFPGPSENARNIPYNGTDVVVKTYFGKLRIACGELDKYSCQQLYLSPDKRFVASMGFGSRDASHNNALIIIWDILSGDSCIVTKQDVMKHWETGETIDTYRDPIITEFFWNNDEISVNNELRLIILADVIHKQNGKDGTVVLVYPWRYVPAISYSKNIMK